MYVPPNRNLPKAHLDKLFSAKNKKAIFIGDFNAHHSLWSDAVENANGRNLHNILDTENLIVVKTSTPTRLDISRMQYSLLRFGDSNLELSFPHGSGGD